MNWIDHQNETPEIPETLETRQEPAPRKKPGAWRKGAALVLSCVLLSGTAGVGGAYLGSRMFAPEAKTETAAPTAVAMAYTGSQTMTPAEVYAANVRSTVGIQTSILTTNYWGQQTTSAASGSGFILTADGYMLTNYHVIEGASAITVSLYDGQSYEARLVGYDESSDIAVLKAEAQGLTPVQLGDSDSLLVGDPVVAIGNPLGELTFSLTHGVVSALDRQVTLSSTVSMALIQTDCAINSGNSGGALFDLYGRVVGITNAKYSGSSSEASVDNIGFAIPINRVRATVLSIIETGTYTRPYIGVSVSSVTAGSLAGGLPAGAAIQSVTSDSPASRAGLQAGDIVTAVNGEAIGSGGALQSAVEDAAAGDVLTLSVYRQGQTLTLSVTVGQQVIQALPETQQTQQTQQSQQSGGYPVFPWGRGFWN